MPDQHVVEDTEHYLLFCHRYDEQRKFSQYFKHYITTYRLTKAPQNFFYGDEKLPLIVNTMFSKATLKYMSATERFKCSVQFSSFRFFVILTFYDM